MDTEIGPCSGQGQVLSAADRDVLIAIIAQLQATVLEQQRVIERLERRIAELGRPGETGRPAPDARPEGEIGPPAAGEGSCPTSSDATALPAGA